VKRFPGEFVVLLLCLSIAEPAAAAILTVTNANDSGSGSLRECITVANGSAGPHRIVFNIPGTGVQTIHLQSYLGGIANTTAIDGRSQPAYNASNGPLIELDGTSAGGNALSLLAPHSSVKGLTFNRFGSTPVGIAADACTLSACYSGVNAAGTAIAGNDGFGVFVTGKNCLIGGHFASDRNILSGNVAGGIGIYSPASGDTVVNNYIGTDVTGKVAIANSVWDIDVENAPNTVIGGPGSQDGNLISASNQSGIFVESSPPSTSGQGIQIYRNFIGTDFTGQKAIANARDGILIWDAYASVGGIGLGNVISGNHGSGVHLLGDQGGNFCTISGNKIGVTADGTGKLGNFVHGIMIENSHNNFIGGSTVDGSGNLIGGNGNVGIDIEGATATDNIVEGNAVGTSFNGALNLGNNLEGIAAAGDGTIVGTPLLGEGNIIARNQGGIFVYSKENSLRGNAIFDNEIQLGIDLSTLSPNPVTPNDSLDGDDGPNYLQNFPVITSVSVVGAQVRLQGRYNAEPNSNFILDFFSNRHCSSWGYGEGESRLGSANVTTNALGYALFDMSFPLTSIVGYVFTCTATDFIGDTSEFSPCAPLAAQTAAQPPGPPAFAFAPPLPSPARKSTSFTFTLAHASRVALRAYDVSGREVAQLAQGSFEAGPHTVAWNVADLRSGVYFCRLKAESSEGEDTATRSVIVLH